MEYLEKSFDRVIFDMTPINAVSDKLTLIRAVQYVCLVVRPGKTPKKAIARACAMVEKAGGKVAGLFFNRVSFNFGAADSYYYYGRRYVTQRRCRWLLLTSRTNAITVKIVGTVFCGSQ